MFKKNGKIMAITIKTRHSKEIACTVDAIVIVLLVLFFGV